MVPGLLKKLMRNEAGMVLPMALVLLVAAQYIIVLGMIPVQSMMMINSKFEQNTRAYYAARAGIEDVVWTFSQGTVPTFPYNLISNINGMSATLSQVSSPVVNGSTTTYTLKSTAKLNNVALSSILTKIAVATGNFPFQYAVATTDGNITIDGTVNSIPNPPNGSGDIFANGNINVSGLVNGSAYYTTGPPTGCSNVTGGCTQKSSITFEMLDTTWYETEAAKGGPCVGSLDISNQTMDLGPICINGNLTIQKNSVVTLKGVVLVHGDVTLKNNAVIRGQYTLPNQYYILVEGAGNDILVENNVILGNNILDHNINLMNVDGDIDVENNANTASIYAPNGAVTLKNNGTVTGAVLGKSVWIVNHRVINYPLSLRSTPFPGFIIGVNGAKITAYSVE